MDVRCRNLHPARSIRWNGAIRYPFTQHLFTPIFNFESARDGAVLFENRIEKGDGR